MGRKLYNNFTYLVIRHEDSTSVRLLLTKSHADSRTSFKWNV